MSRALVLSYWNINQPATGGLRRVNALMEALGSDRLLCQPGPAHPLYQSVVFPSPLRQRPGGINRCLFTFFLPRPARVARDALDAFRPDLIVLTSIWTFWPVRHVHDIRLVLDAHDVLSTAIVERYGRWHPFSLLVRSWERRVARRVDHLFVCSELDRDQFVTQHGVLPCRITVVPNGVHIPSASLAAPPLPAPWPGELEGHGVLFFMGTLRYQPNARALAFLNDTVLPALEQKRPGFFRLVVCGGERPSGTWHPALRFAGKVTDDLLQALMARAHFCLAPIFTGSGTRLKILEYMAAGKAVVSTPKGMEGLEAEPDRDLVVAEPDAFADAILALANSPEKARALGEAGARLIRERYDWRTRSQPIWRSQFAARLPAEIQQKTNRAGSSPKMSRETKAPDGSYG